MKVIETEAIAPQPLRIEGEKSDSEEIMIWDQDGHFIGSEWRMTEEAAEIAKALAKAEVDTS